MGRSAAFSNSVESFWLIIRIEYRAEYLGREELETLALFVGLLPQSADIEVHPALHRTMDCLADVPSASVTGRDAPSPAHIQVPQEDADGFLLPLADEIPEHPSIAYPGRKSDSFQSDAYASFRRFRSTSSWKTESTDGFDAMTTPSFENTSEFVHEMSLASEAVCGKEIEIF